LEDSLEADSGIYLPEERVEALIESASMRIVLRESSLVHDSWLRPSGTGTGQRMRSYPGWEKLKVSGSFYDKFATRQGGGG
jgi:hypothetical protein